MPDTIQTLGRSTIQHGPLNRRVYLMDLHPGDTADIIPAMDRLARSNEYTKILAKVPSDLGPAFESRGYNVEAVVPNYFSKDRDLLFHCNYLTDDRRRENFPDLVSANFRLIETYEKSLDPEEVVPSSPVIRCGPPDVREMSEVFQRVYASYPFPIIDPNFLTDAMNNHTRYFSIREAGKIIALAGSETDIQHGAVEMTDFAVLPPWRGKGLATCLLAHMEKEMKIEGMRVAYTISRTLSPGINMTFKRLGYCFGGTLVNNTHIAGGIESMWVWHKGLE